MVKAVLHISNLYQSKAVEVAGEVSVGRTDAASVVLDDSGLSRKNTTFFIDGDDLLVVDENSLNGTFLNGQRISGAPRVLRDGDEIRIGSDTTIRVSIGSAAAVAAPAQRTETRVPEPAPAAKKTAAATGSKTPLTLLIAIGSSLAIVVFGGIALLIANLAGGGGSSSGTGQTATPSISSAMLIPVRVIDPLGGEDPDDLDDIIAAWEIEDKGAALEDLEQLKSTSASGSSETSLVKAEELNVSVAFWEQQKNLAAQQRSKPTGERPPGLLRTPVIYDNTHWQSVKLAQMIKAGYKLPTDYADLAQKRLDGDLVELPLATQTYFLVVGSEANEAPFNELYWDGNTPRTKPLEPGSPKYAVLKRLADNFNGQKYDLNDPKHRKQIKIRLLRMFNWRAKPILEKLAAKYHAEFKRPLRVTSLTRSMEYQLLLNRSNENSYKVRGAGALPPHTSGCAFDLARKHMDVDEQNFMIRELERMELGGELNAIIEFNVNACFHVFIFFDGKPPK